MGRQELHAEVLEELEGALWKQSWIDDNRLAEYQTVGLTEQLSRVVVGVDPSVTDKDTSDETGIIVAGRTKGNCPFCPRAEKPHAVVLEDASVGRGSPNEWAGAVDRVYRKHGADRVAAEVNNGGDLVETVLQAAHPNLPVHKVHASRGKTIRAEPISALYERGMVHHLGTKFDKVEDQMVTWVQDTGEPSPDRMDALVWTLTELMIPTSPTRKLGTQKDTRHRGRR